MANETSQQTITRYFEDTIAAEHTFEDQLRSFTKTGDLEDVQQLFLEHAQETRRQYERLEARLRALGGKPSLVKSALAHMFAFAPATAQVGHEPPEKNTQNLIMAYAVENAEMAMYEAFAIAAEAAGDAETARLVRQIQDEERRAAEKIWEMLPATASAAFNRVTGRNMAA